MGGRLPGGGAPPPDTALASVRRAEFAALDDVVYLNAASTGPLPARSVEAQAAFTRRRATPHLIPFEEQFGVLTRCRALVARLIGANEADIALAGNTGAGINLAAWGLPLGKGDTVVIPALEYPAGVYPWLAAARARGFTVHTVATREGVLDEDALLAALDLPGVRALSLSWVGFATGAVTDLARLGDACRARGVWFIVDAIQGIGASPLDLQATPVDIIACGAQKWLLGPWGTGFTYVAPSVLETLTVQPVSWMGVRASDDFSRLLEYDLTWRDSARRFEQVTLPYQDFAGLEASLGLLHELGPASVAAHIHRCAAELITGAVQRGLPVVTPRARHAGIASVRPPDPVATSARLDASGIIHSLREGSIRLSPHCYTTDADIDAALRALAAP